MSHADTQRARREKKNDWGMDTIKTEGIAQLPNDSTDIKCYRKRIFKLMRTKEQT